MADRSFPSWGIHCRNSLLCLFSVVSILFMVSWFFLLRSAGSSHLVLLPSPKKHILSDNSSAVCQNQYAVGGGSKWGDNKEILKVFMYNLPPEFHFGLLDWKPEGPSVWPDIRKHVPLYLGGLNLQHSIEYWLTLDLLFSEYSGPSPSRVAVRVYDSSESDVIFVPFFSSLSFNIYSRTRKQERHSHDKFMQDKLVKYLKSQEEWKRSGGVDHIIMAHHPNSLLYARNQLWPATFILSDFGRYPPTIANVQKDVIAPYRHVIKSFVNDNSTFDTRPILLYFQGAIYRKDGGLIRQELFYLLRDEPDVHFTFGSIQRGGVSNATQGMHSSKYCLNIAGDTPSSNRLFDAIASHCVPVIISDQIELPFEDIIDYSEFCIFVRNSDAVKEKFLINLIRGIGKEEWTRMWRKIQEVEKFFEFRYPSRDDDAVQLIWKSILKKVPAIKLKLHRSKRYSRTLDARVKKERSSLVVPPNFW
uniref:Exostosin GT47 domain-containing protein n=3 Tax=Opuntia streptacantha TaxID=393608 RepID=A0A7C9CW06_OPUST